MIRFVCPKCKETQSRPDESAGSVVTCDCGQKIRVPALSTAPSAPARKPAKESEELDELDEVDDLEEADEPPSSSRSSRRSSRRDEEEEEDDQEGPSRSRRSDNGKSKRRGKRKGRKAADDELPPEADELGELRTIHEVSKVGPICGVVFCGLVVLFGLLTFPFCITERSIAPLLLGLPLIALGAGGVLWASWSLGLRVYLFEGGLVRAHRKNFLVVPWDDVEFVWQSITEHYYNGAYTGTTYHYSLQLYDGAYVKLGNNLKGIKDLGEEVMHQTSQALHPKLMTRYNKGKVVDFGKLGISKDGLHYGDSFLKWKEIDAVKIQQGAISVSKRGKWFNWCNIAASQVPNLWVFLSMVDEVKGLNRR